MVIFRSKTEGVLANQKKIKDVNSEALLIYDPNQTQTELAEALESLSANNFRSVKTIWIYLKSKKSDAKQGIFFTVSQLEMNTGYVALTPRRN